MLWGLGFLTDRQNKQTNNLLAAFLNDMGTEVFSQKYYKHTNILLEGLPMFCYPVISISVKVLFFVLLNLLGVI